MKNIYILHQGASILGVYTTSSQLAEAMADWNNEFLRRVKRMPNESEGPLVMSIEPNQKPWLERHFVGQDQPVARETN